ncbi:MAG: ABC transporter permease, partial [Actinobacteria bacterium]|nr:ABC transporter permease [Actinomycetota bacterium]
PRLGRAAIIRALAWHSLRSAFGIGRGAKAKIVPLLAFILMCLPAIVNAVAVAQQPGQPPIVDYDTYTYQLRTLVMLIFVAAQAPELVSRDLRSHVLPLYYSRPMRRLDYPLAKYAAFTAACLLLVEIPLIILYVGNLLSASGGSGVWHQTKALIPGLGAGALWAILLAATGLVIASFTSRRAYATGMIAIYFFLTWILAGILVNIAQHGAGPGLVTSNVPLGARLPGLISPFTVLDGVRQWLGGTNPGPIPNPGSAGVAYGLMFVLLLAVSLGGLAARYRKVGAA